MTAVPTNPGKRRLPPASTTEEVRHLAGDLPFLSAAQGARLYAHVRSERPEHVLELGSAHGVSTTYIAAALEANGSGTITTLDHVRAGWDPQPGDLLARAGLSARAEILTSDDSSYTSFLRERIEERSDEAGNCEPLYDFCFIDGAHAWTIDGFAVLLTERLLRPGGWLLLDDLDWVFGEPGKPDFPGELEDVLRLPHILPWTMSGAERRRPQLRDVFELLIKPHPSFTEMRVEDGTWGWARKAPGEPRRLTLESSRPLSAVLQGRLRRMQRRLIRSG